MPVSGVRRGLHLLGAVMAGTVFALASGCRDAERAPAAAPATSAASTFNSLRSAAERGDVEAQRNLAWAYLEGRGVHKDSALAVRWWRRAANRGDGSAQNSLAWMYFNGEGIAQDSAAAVRWWKLAGTQGNAPAQDSLGWAYFNGVGARADMVLGYAWTNLAAGQGIERARINRDAFEKRMTATQVSQAQKLSSTWKVQIDRLAHALGNGARSVAARLQKVSEGTAFLINDDGNAVTANHVVAGCQELRMRGRSGRASVLQTDPKNDLALVKLSGLTTASAILATHPERLRQGDTVIVFGFPLNSVLSVGGNLTPGIISALTGLGNDPNQLQSTAPIQPGSSGSPVMDDEGVVVGVVSMSLSNARMIEATGASGQNVNFAVSGVRLNAFLDSHGVAYRRGGGFFRRTRAIADIADDARAWTRVLECWK